MNKERFEIELNQEDAQNIINCYEKDMKLIKQLQQQNKELKERISYLERSCERKEETIRNERDENIELSNKIDNIKSFIITNKPVYIEQKGKPCIIDVTNDLLEILKG